MPLHVSPRAWVEVDLEAIAHNLDIARQALPHTDLMPIIKAGAYGHGLEAVARRLDQDGIAFFGVANVSEARRLHQAGVRTRPFILAPTFPDEREEIVNRQWCATLSSLEEARHFNELAAQYGRKQELHICLDTGMGREGFYLPSYDALTELAQELSTLSHLHINGIMSHCPSADEDIAYTQQQIEYFEALVAEWRQYLPLRYCHLAASAGQLGYEIPMANLARPGLLLYGVAPIASIYDGVLRPTLRLRSRICLIKELPAGHGISYGGIYQTTRPTRVATVGIGYADGWNRDLSASGVNVCIEGQLYPMIGRVTMDQIMIDISDKPSLEIGQIVDLICPEQPVTEVARLAGSIPWEIFTGLGPRLPRIYHRSGN